MVWLGIVLSLVTSACWALGNVLTQRAGRRIGPVRAMFWAMAAGAVVSGPFAFVFDTRPGEFSPVVGVWIAVGVVSALVAYVGLFFAFANEGLTIAVPIVSSWALVSGVMSVVFLGESVRRLQLVGAALVLGGVILVSLARPRDPATTMTDAAVGVATDAARSTKASRVALVSGLASALGFGVMVPAMAKVAPSVGAFGATSLVFALGIVVAFAIGRTFHVDLEGPPRSAWPLLIATGSAETLGFVSVALAKRFATMTLVAPVASLSATLTVLYAWVVMKERPHALALAGAAASAIGVVILAM